MEKMTGIYLTDKDKERLEKIKEVRETTKTTEAIKILIKEEYSRILMYQGKL